MAACLVDRAKKMDQNEDRCRFCAGGKPVRDSRPAGRKKLHGRRPPMVFIVERARLCGGHSALRRRPFIERTEFTAKNKNRFAREGPCPFRRPAELN
jgi:hypothetical protein